MLTQDATKRPMIYVADTCPRLMGGIETYQLDPDTGEPKKNQSDDEVNAWRYNVMRITKLRQGVPINRELTSKAAGALPAVKPSQMMAAVKAERRDVLRRMIEQADRELPAETGRRR